MADQLTCVVVTPESTALEEPAEFVALPLDDGEIGILPGRAPLIGRLGYGELRIRSGGKISRYYVDGGFVQVADNVVSILTNRALPADRLDAVAAGDQLQAAFQRRASTPEEELIRDRLIAQSRAQVRLAARK